MSTTFSSWVRTGIAGTSGGATPLLAPATDAARLTTRLRASVNGTPAAAVDVAVFGPGDVAGIDPGQIVRSDPHPGAEGFETTRFALVELARADLPWQFTPQVANPRLRPWIALVVVPAAECELTPQRDRLPVLTVDQRQLPPLASSWAWAHVQAPSTSGAPGPGARSRLVCPRQLRPFTRYLAAVVPTFEAGRRTGMGLDPGAELGDAWGTGAGDVDLPVYHHWFFATGEAGDFESLARGLTALPQAPAGLGAGTLDVGAPGPAGLAAPGRTTPLLGPVAAPGAGLAPWGPADRTALAAELVPPTAARVLGPPVYGALASATDVAAAIPTTGTRRWVGQLNLHPAQRAAAGLGATVVRRRQHDFVQEAWEQAGQVLEANRLLNQGRLGRRVSLGLERRHVAPRIPVDLLQLASPLLRRVPHRTLPVTLAADLRRTMLPPNLLGPAFRRLARPTGPIARRGLDAVRRERLVTEVNAGTLVPDRSLVSRPGGLLTIGGLVDVLEAARQSWRLDQPVVFTPRSLVAPAPAPAAPLTRGGRAVRATGGGDAGGEVKVSAYAIREGTSIRVTDRNLVVAGSLTIHLDDTMQVPPKAILQLLDPEKLTAAHLSKMQGMVHLPFDGKVLEITESVRAGLLGLIGAAPTVPPKPAAALQELADTVRLAVSPAVAVRDVVLSTVNRPLAAVDPLEPVMVAPSIDEALWDDLVEVSGDLFLPGADLLEREHATILATNPGFVAAFMAGANEEMMRELRWRGYPTDGRGTVFRRFWDRYDAQGAPLPDLRADVHAWRNALGDDLAEPSGELVLVVRSELFRRYPGTLVTAVRALPGTPRRPDHASARPPSFHGNLPRGAAFFGFPIPLEEAVGEPGNAAKPGWFIVFHQPPTDLGFGLDDPTPEAPGEPPTWLDPTALGADAAAVAVATSQLPIRLAVHASDLAGLAVP
ncbi:MAG: hypothetical protein AB7L84_00135 [Acidimicrobiia bacterium]